MTLEEIDALIADLADENDFPLSAEQRADLERIKAANDIPMKECWKAADTLQLAACWEALTQLRATVSG